MPHDTPAISLVIPAYNEAARIATTVLEAVEYFRGRRVGRENGGSDQRCGREEQGEGGEAAEEDRTCSCDWGRPALASPTFEGQKPSGTTSRTPGSR